MCDRVMLLTCFLCGVFLLYIYPCLRDSYFDDRGDAVHVHSILSANGMEVSHFSEMYRCITDPAYLDCFLFVCTQF